MAQLLINIGESVNDKRGDPLRTAFDKVNQNFTELFATDTSTKYHLGDDTQFVDIDPDSGMVVIQSGYDKSMPVYIKGGNCSDGGVGGNVVIEAGGAPLGIDNFINGTTGNVEIAGQDVTIEAGGGITTFSSNGEGTPYVLFPADNYGGQLGVQGGGIEAINSLGLGALNGIVAISTVNANNTTGLGWVFDQAGTLTTPLLFPVAFTAVLDAAHCTTNPDLSLTGPAWEFNLEWQVAPNGEVGLLADNGPLPSLVAGYADDQTFEFTEADHGIPGYTLTIVLSNVVYAGPAGWTANLNFSEPPVYPSTINSLGAIKVTSNENSWTFGTDGVLTLPVGGDIVDSNGDSVLGGPGGAADRLVAGDKSVILDTNGDLTVPGEIKSAAGTGDVVIESNNGTSTHTWTFGSDSYFNLPGGTSAIIAEENAVIVQAGNAPGDSNLALSNLGVNLVSEQNIQLMAGGGTKRWRLDTNGTLTLPTTNKITAANIPAEGTRITDVENYGTNLGSNTYTWHVADCPVFSSAMDAGLLTTGSKFYPMGQPGQEVFVLGTGGTLEDLNVSFSGSLGGGPFTIESDYYVAEQLANVTIESNGNDWIFGNDGVLSFPDTHLTIENSTIGRKVVTIFDDGIVHTEDAEGSRLVFTDTSTSLETYSDPDGVNNIMMARHYTNGAATAGLEVYTEIVSGRIGTSLVVTGSGVEITSGDGVVDNTWNFDIGGDLAVPGRIKQQDQPTEINLNTGGVGNILISTNTDFDTHLLLNPGAGAALSANVAVSLSAGVGISAIHQAYLDAEALWEVARDEDAAMIVPLTRPWAGSSGYDAYYMIIGYTPPPGYDVPINMAPLAHECRTRKYDWDAELADTNVSINVKDKTWTFGTDGKFLFPSGAGFLNGDSGQLKTDSGSTTSLDFRDGTGRGFYTNSDGFSLRSDSDSTWKFGPDNTLTLADTASKIYTLNPATSGGISGLNLLGNTRTFISITGSTEYAWDFRSFGLDDYSTDKKPTIMLPGSSWIEEDLSNEQLNYGVRGPLLIGSQDKLTLRTNLLDLENHGLEPLATYDWVFGNDGILTLPAGGDIVDSNGTSVLGSGGGSVVGVTSSATTTYRVSVDWNWGNWDDVREIGGFTVSALFYSVLKSIQPGDNITVNGTDSYVIDHITTGAGNTGYFHIFITTDSANRFASVNTLAFDIVDIQLAGNTTIDSNLIINHNIRLKSGADIKNSAGDSVLVSREPAFTIVSTSTFLAVAGYRYGVNTTDGAITAYLPQNPVAGDAIFFVDSHGTFSTNNLTINGNEGAPFAKTIMGQATQAIMVDNDNVGLFYNGTEWRFYA